MDQTLKRVAALVGGGDVESRCAALVVLTQLQATDDPVVRAVTAALESPNVVVRDFALTYLEQTEPATALGTVSGLLDAEDDGVRQRAAAIAASYGAAAIAAAKKLLRGAPRRRLNAIIELCARVRTAGATDLLFQIMAEGDFETNRLAGDAMEAGIRAMSEADRAAFYTRLDKFADSVRTERVQLVSALKLLGALGDARARRRLFGLLGADQPHAIRTHAVAALVHCLRGETVSEAEIERLLPLLSEDDEAGILRPAMALLDEPQLARKHLDRLQQLAESPQAVVKRFAVQKLGAFDSDRVVKQLIAYLTDASYARRSEATASLKKTPAARALLMKELLSCDDERLAWTLTEVLLAHDRAWRKDVREQLWQRFATALVDREDRLFSAYFEFLRQLDEPALLERIRSRGQQLLAKKNFREAVRRLQLLRDTPAGDDELKYALAIAELRSHPRSLTAPVRRHDAGIELLRSLAGSAFSLAERLRKERALTPDDRVYVGFALAEGSIAERAVAADVLEPVAAKFARTKAGKAAKNKLRLLGGQLA